MIARLMLWLAAVAWMPAGFAQSPAPALIFVASARSPIEHLSGTEARKLYLGVPQLAGGRPLKPVHNDTDPVCHETFLQKVMFMSADAYERQILDHLFRFGGNRPAAYADARELVKALQSDLMTVSYMQRDRIAAAPGLKIVGEP